MKQNFQNLNKYFPSIKKKGMLFLFLLLSYCTTNLYAQNRALDFDGVNDYVEIPNNPTFATISAVTVEAWIRTTSTSESYIVTKGNSGSWYLAVNISGGSNKASIFIGGVSAAWLHSTTNVNDGNWHHVAGTYDGSTIKIYVDGIEENKVARTGPINTASTSPVFIGIRYLGGLYPFNGQIDEVRIWNIARTCSQIRANRGNNLAMPQTGLVAYYQFNQGTAGGANAGETTLNDATSNNLNGTLTNFALTGATSNWVTSTTGVTGTTPIPQPEINVEGNTVTILDGDITPSATDNTDFGNVSNASSKAVLYTIRNTETGILNVSSIVSSGANAANFVVSGVPASVAAGGTATFTVTFTSAALGVQNATITVNSNDCDEAAYDFAVTSTSVSATTLIINCPSNMVLPSVAGTCESAAIKYYPTITGGAGDYNLPIAGYTYLGNATNGHSYYLSNGSANYLAARQAALDAGGYLAVIDDATENALVRSYVVANGLPYVLLGYDDIDNEGTFEWYTGQATIYTNWVGGEPNDFGGNEDATTLQSGGQWNDLPSTVNHRYIVEIPRARTIQTTGLPTCSKFPVGVTTNTFVSTDRLGNTATCSFTVTVNAPNVEIKGNDLSIADGDVTPSISDDTYFGNVNNGFSKPISYAIENTGTQVLNITSSSVTGANAANFVISNLPTTVAAGGTATFTVTFTPSALGVRNAIININSDDCDAAVYNFAVKGNSTASPALAINCPSNANLPVVAGTCFSNIFKYYPTVTGGFGNYDLPIAGYTYLGNAPNGHSYYLSTGTADYSAARMAALTAGGYLAVIQDAAEDALIKSYLAAQGVTPVLIGFDDLDVEGTYEWYTGQPTTYTNWIPGEPDNAGNQDATLLQSGSGWTNLQSNIPVRYIVEIPRALTVQTAGLPTTSKFPVGVTTNTYVTTDKVGNTATCSFTVTVNDTKNIDVKGNGISIVDGDITPVIADNTNFGSVASGSSKQITYTIANTGTDVLNITSILASGANAANFVVSGAPTSVAAGSTATFKVTFNSTGAIGAKNATITIINNNCINGVYDFAITANTTAVVSTLAIACPGNVVLNTTQGTCQSVALKYYPTVTGGGIYNAPIAGYTYLGNAPNGHSYYLSNGSANYLVARQAALDAGGHLVVIDDAAENTLIKGYLTSNSLAYILLGYDDVDNEGTFEWYTGQPTVYTNWRAGEPNDYGSGEDATTLQNNGGWNDLKSTVNHRYIVEVPGAKTIQTTGLPTCSKFPVGVTTNTFVTTDILGNTATCSFTVTVADIDLPLVIAKADVVRNASAACTFVNTGASAIANGTATDNCGIASYSYVLTGASTGTVTTLAGQVFNAGITTVTWTATDVNGNVSVADVFTVTVNDTQIPVATAKADEAFNTPVGACVFTNNAAQITEGVGTDNCTTTNSYVLTGATTGTVTTLAGQVFNVGVTTVTWRVIDAAGNVSAADVFTVTITVSSANNAEINVVGNAVSIVDGDITPSLTDNTDFGAVLTGNSNPIVYTIQNTGSAVLNITSILASGADATEFAVSGVPATVAAGGTANFTVTFNPTSSGMKAATITILNNDCNEATYDFVVAGNVPAIVPTLTSTPPTNQVFDAVAGTCESAIYKYYPTISGGIGNYSAPIAGYTYLGSGTNGHSYYVSVGTADYLTARQAALDAGGHLVVIDDATENALIQSYVVANSLPISLIGLDDYDNEGTYQWYTGTPLGYTNWLSGQPNNWGTGGQDAIAFQSGQWADFRTADLFRYIVEIPRARTIQTTGLPTTSKFPVGVTTNTFVTTDMLGNTVTSSFTVTVNDRKQIDVQGNAISIAKGDITPSVTDNTDFGNVNTFKILPYTITNLGTEDLIITSITVSGLDATDFAVNNSMRDTVAAGGSTTFEVVFTAPSTLGIKNATITINNNTCEKGIYDFAVTANAQAAPALVITCPTNIVLPSVIGTCESASYKYYPQVSGGGGNFNIPFSVPGYTYLGVAPNGSSYYLSDGKKNYLDARQAALDAGGHLVVIDDATENQIIRNYVRGAGLSYALLGYDDVDNEGTFEWYTGQPTVYTNWRAGEPNNFGGNEDATTIQSNGGWNDLPATTLHRYIVEVPVASTIQTAGLPTCSKFPVGVTTNTFVITDRLGNTNTCSFTVTVTDSEAPVATAQPDYTRTTDAGVCTYTNTGFIEEGMALDPCGVVSYSYTLSGATVGVFPTLAGIAFNKGITTVTWTATDVNGLNSIADVFTVTVTDNVIPTITAPANVTVNINAGLCTASSVALGTPTGADNCGTPTFTNNAPATFPIGNTTVTWTANDGNGNTATATQTVTVKDNVLPIIATMPSNITVSVDAGLCTASGVVLGTPTGTDNCGTPTFSNNAPALFPVGTTTVTWTINDGNGNTATATQTVTVTENTLPTITAPANVTVNIDAGLCTASSVALGIPTGADNCGTVTFTSNAPALFPIGITTVTWTANDGNGNTATATHTVTVIDNVLPVITFTPANVSVNADAGLCTASGVALGTPVATDNCGTPTFSNNAPALFPIGTTTVTWTANDGNGNTTTTTQTVTVIDNQLPVITALSNVSRNADAGVCTFTNVASSIPNGTGTDNCGVASYSYILSGATTGTVATLLNQVFNVGVTTVTWTAIDVNTNVSVASSFTVTVVDTQLPTLTAVLANVSRNADLGACSFTNTIGALNIPNGTATDNCSVVSFEYVLSGATTATVSTLATQAFNVGVTTVTWTAKDVNNNISLPRSFTVTVTDTQNPIITFTPANIVIPNDPIVCGGATVYTFPTATDNCGIASIVQTAGLPSGSIFPPNVTTNTFLVTDIHGNTSTTSFTVTVNQHYELVYLSSGFQETYPTTSGAMGNTVTISSYACEIFAGAIGENYVATGKVNVSNIPAGLTASIIKISNTELRFSLLGAANPNTQADNIGNLTVVFNDAAFTGVTATNVVNSSRTDLYVTFLDYIPLNLVARGISPTQMRLTWAINNPIHTMYHLYRGNVMIATLPPSATSYIDENRNPDTFYEYTIIGVTSRGIETDPSSGNDWTFPVAPTVVSVSTVCGSGKAVIQLRSSAFVYNVYADSTSTTPLMQKNGDEIFELPFVTGTTTFYISVIGKDFTEIKESTRTAVRVVAQSIFEAKIVGETNKVSCDNFLELQAEEVENATYTWLLNGTGIGLTGRVIIATYSGSYQVRIQKGVCSFISEKVEVKLNQKPVARIAQSNKIRFCDSGILNAILINPNATYKWLLNGVIVGEETSVLVSESGIYTLQVTQNDCQSTAQIEVFVLPTPESPVLETNQTTICSNTETTISVQNADNNVIYQWFRNGRNLRQTGSTLSTSIQGTYQVLAIASGNFACSIFSNEIVINRIETKPIYLRISQDKKTLLLEDILGTQDEIASVEWYFEGESNASLGSNFEITPTEDGNYSARVTTPNGCIIKTRTVYFRVPKVPVITGEEEIKSDVFSIYPNPSTGIFKVRFPTVLVEKMDISVFDVTGKAVKTQVFEKNNQDFIIDIQGLPKGVYLIRFTQQNSTYSKSVVIE